DVGLALRGGLHQFELDRGLDRLERLGGLLRLGFRQVVLLGQLGQPPGLVGSDGGALVSPLAASASRACSAFFVSQSRRAATHWRSVRSFAVVTTAATGAAGRSPCGARRA